jgi:hypothetical protein
VTVPEFQRHSGNDTPLAVILFTETKINYTRPNQTSEDGERPQQYFWQPKIAGLRK